MIYVMSDLHGCYREFKAALKAIDFSPADVLYILGDIVDRGPASIALLQDIMLRPNVIPLIGNHEYMAMKVLKKLWVEITEDTVQTHLTSIDMQNYFAWHRNGGSQTLAEFQKLCRQEQQEILEYLEEFSLWEEITAGQNHYVLVHAGLEPFLPQKPLEDYKLSEMIFQSPDYSRPYFKHAFLVTGHTPTFAIPGAAKGRIYKQNNHISIDCGCVYGACLGVYCLDNGKEWYIDAWK